MKRILSKFFRVATEGETIDGRVISGEWIKEMAETYNTSLFGARVWLEHFRGIIPGGPFDALGDVHAVQAKEEEGKWRLYAQIEPSPALIEMNRNNQKIYSSVEIQPDFAKTGKAYLCGLAVTDDPASLGTERLAFNANNPSNFYKGPILDDNHLYTQAQEVVLDFSDESADDTKETGKSTLLEKVTTLFNRKDRQAEERFDDIDQATIQVAEQVANLTDEFGKFRQQADAQTGLSEELKELKKEFSALTAKLESEADPGQQHRSIASGGSGDELADC